MKLSIIDVYVPVRGSLPDHPDDPAWWLENLSSIVSSDVDALMERFSIDQRTAASLLKTARIRALAGRQSRNTNINLRALPMTANKSIMTLLDEREKQRLARAEKKSLARAEKKSLARAERKQLKPEQRVAHQAECNAILETARSRAIKQMEAGDIESMSWYWRKQLGIPLKTRSTNKGTLEDREKKRLARAEQRALSEEEKRARGAAYLSRLEKLRVLNEYLFDRGEYDKMTPYWRRKLNVAKMTRYGGNRST